MNSVNSLFDRPPTRQSSRAENTTNNQTNAGTPKQDERPLFQSFDDGDDDTDDSTSQTNKKIPAEKATSRHGSAKGDFLRYRILNGIQYQFSFTCIPYH